jgi:hypothetical protein
MRRAKAVSEEQIGFANLRRVGRSEGTVKNANWHFWPRIVGAVRRNAHPPRMPSVN